MKRKEATPEQKQAAQERKARMRALAKQIAAMTEEQRAQLIATTPVVTVAGRVLSPVNQCMIISQNPRASVVGGFRQWIDAGRSVRKGEHGVAIWIPIGTAKAAEAETPGEVAGDSEGIRFALGTVFDISQTDEATAKGTAQ